MRIHQLTDILIKLDKNRRIKFQNGNGWGDKTMPVNAILEEGNAYILIWVAHPHLIKEKMNERQKLVWYNPELNNAKLIPKYFPDYKEL